ncbi:PDZ domain-containing protein [Desulfurobacterium atlanticum]|uniref:General secretion pathway protein C n=1 Tax=Desulfurobacterium atlanticum TaxID=240169 RepID=A0A238ZC53_9BACT|nr:PDZ domain-containing protein [Desulfurobacterium atlanticum]SNR80578.1 general secretion pathway protein C [Desulfurobacterium atlanticum]
MEKFTFLFENYKGRLLRTVPVFIYALAFAVFGVFIGVVSGGFVFEKIFSIDLRLPEVERNKEIKKSKEFDYSGIDKVFGALEDRGDRNIEGKTGTQESSANTGNIKIAGTLIAGKVKYAIVETGDIRRILREGEQLDGFKLVKVEKFFVEVEKGGRRFKIRVFGKDFKGVERKIEKSTRPSSATVHSTAPKVIKLARAMVEKETADIGKLLKDVAIMPVLRGGKTIGYKFARIKRGSILRKIGLKPGDIILSVNDVPVTTVDDTFKIYNILRNEDTVKVELERRGHREVIIYEIR